MKVALLNNRYRILEILGRGGFGETYLTEDTHMPSRRKCVLKQLKPIVKNPKTPLWMKERFQREAAILEELGEKNSQIPRLYAYFSEDDKFYLVQEWIEGLTLDRYWEQEGNLHRDEVRQILLQLLPVLDFVHSRRIIHRDIKPENIVLRRGDNCPFLIDFGAVKEAIATEINQEFSSNFSASIGTPGYMSSEQAAGRPIYSSDLYSLGLTAIFLLTGKNPHELETDPRNGEIIWQEHAQNVDSELIEVIDKAIRFHPRDRFSSAREMFDALQNGVFSNEANNLTGVTLNVAPANNYRGDSQVGRNNTVALNRRQKPRKSKKKRSLLTNLGLFALIAIGVGAGAFATGFAIISNVLRSPEEPQQIETPSVARQPDISETSKDKEQTSQTEAEAEGADRNSEKTKKKKKLKDIFADVGQQQDPNSNSDSDKPEPVAEDKQPKILTKSDIESAPEVDFPILTTGTSESQLVSTLGEPNSQRQGWRPNSRVLVYYDVVPDRVNLSYQSDDTGKIRQTDVALNSSVSLGTMQQTLNRMLEGNATADVKNKLRSVYNRQTSFSFFKIDNLEGKVQRDSKDRINISVWEKGFQ